MKTKNLRTGQVTINATETLIVAERFGRFGLVIKADALNSEEVFVGPTGVTIANGIPLAAGESIPMNVDAPVYGISASGGQEVSYGETHL